MNLRRRHVSVNSIWVERSRAFGHEMVRYYAEEGASSPSRSRSGDRGAERDPVRQGIGKVGECAMALLAGLNPAEVVKWSVGNAVAGSDLPSTCDLLLDVTSTETWKRFLISSRSINDLYDSKTFHYLVAVSVYEHDWSECWIEGCISKAGFRERHLVADGHVIGKGLEPGTWFLEK